MIIKNTQNYPIIFHINEISGIDFYKCGNEIEQFINKYFGETNNIIEEINIVNTLDENAIGGTVEYGKRGYVIKLEAKLLGTTLIPSEILSGFNKDDIKISKQHQDNLLFHELQHVKNKIDHSTFYQINNPNTATGKLSKFFLEEYFAYYECQIQFPIEQDFTNEFLKLSTDSKIELNKLIQSKQVDKIVQFTEKIFYCFAAALAINNANNVLNKQNETIKHINNPLITIFEKIEKTVYEYQKNNKDKECARAFKRSMEAAFENYFNTIDKISRSTYI